eukprot:c25664_g1_i1 orf=45-365(-)
MLPKMIMKHIDTVAQENNSKHLNKSDFQLPSNTIQPNADCPKEILSAHLSSVAKKSTNPNYNSSLLLSCPASVLKSLVADKFRSSFRSNPNLLSQCVELFRSSCFI